MSVADGISLSASPVRASLVRIRRAVAPRVFIDLRLGRVQKYKQTRVIRIVRVIHQSIEQIRRRHRCVSRKISGTSNIKRHCVGPVLKQAVVDNQIDARNCCVTQGEVTVCVRAEAIQIEHCI